jgi:hypothetical protein
VPPDKADAIMDRLLAKMKDVGFERFDLGLPGNLVSVRQADYVYHHHIRWGAGQREDNADGFQIYENGGANPWPEKTVATIDIVNAATTKDNSFKLWAITLKAAAN